MSLLSGDALDSLLAALGPDRDKAGEQYEAIRRKLIRLFEWRGCAYPEDLTDETFNRVARRMAEGVELRSVDPFGYFCGVAHLLFKEAMRRQMREQQVMQSALESAEWMLSGGAEEEGDSRLEPLRECLETLSPEQRRLVLDYHQDDNHIRTRKALSEELGLPMNALRIRVHRIRRRLEDCVTEKLRK
jgi:RNA polymerase sigma factor (sigma-70 family)